MREIKRYKGIIYNKEELEEKRLILYMPEETPLEYFTCYGILEPKKKSVFI